MELNDLQTLYELACANVSRDPDAGQFAVWESVLLRYRRADVRQTLEEWWSDTTQIEWYGTMRSKGSFLPTPADLLPGVLRLKEQRREARTFKPCHLNGCSYEGLKRLKAEDGEFDIVPCECRLAWEGAHGSV
jgi:hypothetical protein